MDRSGSKIGCLTAGSFQVGSPSLPTLVNPDASSSETVTSLSWKGIESTEIKIPLFKKYIYMTKLTLCKSTEIQTNDKLYLTF